MACLAYPGPLPVSQAVENYIIFTFSHQNLVATRKKHKNQTHEKSNTKIQKHGAESTQLTSSTNDIRLI